MSHIKIHHAGEAEPCNKLEQFVQRIRERAHSLFEKRQCADGHALDDWLQAEQELLFKPEMAIEDRNDELRLTADMGDFKAREIHIDALSNSILVTAEHQEGSHGDRVERECIAQFDLPESIDPNRVTARLHGARLEITAAKLRQPAQMAAGQ